MVATADIISAIQGGDETIMEVVYDQYRTEFLVWGQKSYPLEREALIDIYQDAVIILYQNVAEKKMTSLSSTLKTYLFGIAKHLIFRELNRQNKGPQRLDEVPEIAVAPHYLQQATEDHTQYHIRNALDKLGSSCRQLIEYFYYYDFSMEVIAQRMRYKNANTVKAQKRRCMQQLEDLFKADKHE